MREEGATCSRRVLDCKTESVQARATPLSPALLPIFVGASELSYEDRSRLHDQQIFCSLGLVWLKDANYECLLSTIKKLLG